MSIEYKAFISYAHEDANRAARLQRRLESFRLTQDGTRAWPLRPIFLDRSELASSPSLSDSITEALRMSDALIVICSPAAARSRWVNEEIVHFKRLGKTSVYPIVISGDPGSVAEDQSCFPPALLWEMGADGELTDVRSEPLAADARRGQDGRDAELKLIAGLLSVPYDSLKLRQQHKRIRQISAIAAGSAAMLVLTLFLAFAAITGQQEAERRRDQAEGLINFMLGDLRSRLEPVGRLDVLDAVGEQALEYFSSLDGDELTEEALLARATALRQIGEVRVAQGRIEEGLVAFNQARDALETGSASESAQHLFELGQLQYWIADAYFRELRLAEAREHITAYLMISRELVALEPDNSDYQLELAYAESNLGTLSFRENDMEDSRAHFERALVMIEKLAGVLPEHGMETERANTISWLGAVEASVGNLSAASRWYSEEVSIYRSLVVATGKPELKHDLARALWLLNHSNQLAGQSELTGLDESIRIYRELIAYDPLNFEWHRGLAWALLLRSRFGFASGVSSAAESRALIALANEALDQTSQEESAETRRVVSAAIVEQARLEFIDGSNAEALSLLRNSMSQLEPHMGGEDRVRALPVYARGAYLASEVLYRQGEHADASLLAAASLDVLAVTDRDSVIIRAYGALLAFRANDPRADHWQAQIFATEYRAPLEMLNSDIGLWWEGEASSSSVR